jgi:hypothetical protein
MKIGRKCNNSYKPGSFLPCSNFMKKKIALAVLFFAAANSYAIKYHSALGLRFGKFSTGASFKHFYDADNRQGIELNAYYTNIPQGGYTIKGFYVLQNHIKIPIIQLPLDFIFGGGLHVAYFPYHEDRNDPGYYRSEGGRKIPYYKSVIVAGVDATVQIEYKIPMRRFPFALSFDVNPFYEVLNRGPEWLDFGFAVRYCFR